MQHPGGDLVYSSDNGRGYIVLSPALLVIFYTSPDTDDPTCICSLCLNRIFPPEIAMRIFGVQKETDTDEQAEIEMRFHQVCFKLLLPLFLGEGFNVPEFPEFDGGVSNGKGE